MEKSKRGPKGPSGPRSAETWFIINGKPGEVLYTTKADKIITAASVTYKRPLTTERILAISYTNNKREIIDLTKITLL